jgi:hypothetical protein
MTNFVLNTGIKLTNVHESDQCGAETCVIHNPSNHPYRDMPMSVDIEARILRIPADGSGPIVDPDTASFRKQSILRNSAYCVLCETHIYSTYRHDFVSCGCGNIFVDGGYDYARHGFDNASAYKDTTIYLEN